MKVAMSLKSNEPAVEVWWVVEVAEAVRRVVALRGTEHEGPLVVAVDGRSASGKSTFAHLLQAAIPDCALVHTDDVAWHESFFDWGPLMAAHVLSPLRLGQSVHYRPEAWERNDRPGYIDVSATCPVLVIEGVGSSQKALGALIDVKIWVQSDFKVAEARGIARDIASGINGDERESVAFWHLWMGEEVPFLDRDRPWERADLVVAGSSVPGVHSGRLAIAEGPLSGTKLK